jgi:hypothetical protein
MDGAACWRGPVDGLHGHLKEQHGLKEYVLHRVSGTRTFNNSTCRTFIGEQQAVETDYVMCVGHRIEDTEISAELRYGRCSPNFAPGPLRSEPALPSGGTQPRRCATSS